MKRTGKAIQPKPAFDSEGYQANLDSLNGEPLPDLGKVVAKPFKHGGARVGAGRRPSGNEPILLRLSPRTVSKLRQLARRKKKNNSVVAGEILEAGLSEQLRRK